MHKTIKNISILKFKEIEERQHDRCLSLPIPDSFKDEPLLKEVHKISKVIFPCPESGELGYYCSDWYGCDIFGNRYTLGCINNLSEEEYDNLKGQFFSARLLEKISKGEINSHDKSAFRNELWKINLLFHRKVLKPIQDKYLDGMKERYITPDIISTLLAMNIDPVQFWYVLLWIKDYIDGKTKNVHKYEDTPLESLEHLALLLNSVTDIYDVPESQKQKWSEAKENNESVYDYVTGLLTLKVGNYKKITVTNPETLKLLGKIISEFTENTETKIILKNMQF